MIQQNEQNDVVEQWNEFCKMKDEMTKRKRKMNEEMDTDERKMKQMMEEITKGMSKKEEEIGKLRKENCALKLKMTKMEAYMKKKKFSIPPGIIPAELLNELFASMPFENAFNLLAKMPNGLLARNVQKMINGIKETIKNNKLNEEDCGPKLNISEEGLQFMHIGPNERNGVRAVLPIPIFNLKGITKSIIAYYFELQILTLRFGGIIIGFCLQQFPLEGDWHGYVNNSNSIGIVSKEAIWIDGSYIKFENAIGYFEKGDFIGLGIICHPSTKMECFATLNGNLLGKTKLPSKFVGIKLYPAIWVLDGDSTRVNFGKEEWRFKEFGCVLE